jgi:hypothetical protein
MSAEDFAAWVAHMKESRGWSARECARQLDCGINSIANWSKTGAPLYIGLACAALAFGLPPWAAVHSRNT